MIPFLDLKAQHQAIRPEITAAMDEVFENTSFILGPAVSGFEDAFARYCQSDHCIAVNSGTSALHLVLSALEIGPGDEVITVPMTFIATVSAIDYTGARPVFVDVDPVTWNMDPTKIEAAITPRTKAIMPVHLHGRVADMSAIQAVADRHGLTVIEDAAQAHGGQAPDGRRAGSLGHVACFSFYPGKNLGACGEGGAITTSDPALAERIRLLRDWGQTRKYHHDLKGFNYRMDGLQGAALTVKLRHLDGWTDGRGEMAQIYDRELSGRGIGLPKADGESRHSYHVYAIRIANRDELIEALKAAEIGFNIHYPIPVHLQKAFAELGHKRGDSPVSEALADSFLSLPMFPELGEERAVRVSALVKQVAHPLNSL